MDSMLGNSNKMSGISKQKFELEQKLNNLEIVLRNQNNLCSEEKKGLTAQSSDLLGGLNTLGMQEMSSLSGHYSKMEEATRRSLE